MVAKTHIIPGADEDIIELTDLIARGTPPAPVPSVVPAVDHLSDLRNSNDKDDLDALLAEISAAHQAIPKIAPSQAGQNTINPDETLDMPNMREVENLLGELKIPAQPSAANGVADTKQSFESLDDILEQLGTNPPAAPAVSTMAATAPVTPAAPAQQSDPADELDALLDSVAAPLAVTVPPTAPAKEPDAPPGKFATATPPTAPAAPAAPAPQSDPADELDALLGSVAAPPASAVPPTIPTEDLDALLDSVAAPAATATPPTAPAKKPDTPPGKLAAATPPTAPAAPAAPTPQSDPADELDALLSSVAAPPAAAAPPTIPTEDLDALLDSVAAPSAAVAPPTAPAKKPDTPPSKLAAAASTTTPAAKIAQSSKTLRVSAVPPMPTARPVAPQIPKTADVMPQTSQAAAITGDLDAFLASIPAAPPAEEADEMLPPLPAQAAPDAIGNVSKTDAVFSCPAPAPSRPARETPAATEKLPLPRQWENLPGGTPEQTRTTQPAESAPGIFPLPPVFLEQFERMEKRLEHLEMRLDAMERDAKAELERAAAIAAARILREELAALIAEVAE